MLIILLYDRLNHCSILVSCIDCARNKAELVIYAADNKLIPKAVNVNPKVDHPLISEKCVNVAKKQTNKNPTN